MFIPTFRQRLALGLFKSPAIHTLLYGGSRSGKTSIIVEALIYRALNYPGSRHLAARLRYSHARTTLWHETLLPALKRIPSKLYTISKRDSLISFTNDSEIWVGGLDDKERVEKLLGHEYSSIYLNEVSQIEYPTVEVARTRLAQSIKGLINKAYYDENPPSPLHWTHKEFIERIEPKSENPLRSPDLFASLLMNPVDNKEHIPEGYIENILENLPEAARRRFLLGEWVKQEGMILGKFNDSLIQEVPYDDIEEWVVGLDFGLNMAAVLIGIVGDKIYIADDMLEYNITSSKFNDLIKKRWGQYDYHDVYCDPSGGERIQEITYGVKANNSVDPGLDYMNMKFERGELIVSPRAKNFLSEVWDYRRDDNERMIKVNDHVIDAGRYGIYSRMAQGIQVFV